jgi:hypothetical protein
MNSEHEDFDDAEAAKERDQHGLALHQLVQDYLDEHDLPDEAGVVILLGIGIRMRMVSYALESEEPSGAGLKRDLDHFQRDIEHCVQAAKEGAEEFIKEAMVLRDQADAEMDGEDEQDGSKGIPS